jgi:hypothetical protein
VIEVSHTVGIPISIKKFYVSFHNNCFCGPSTLALGPHCAHIPLGII